MIRSDAQELLDLIERFVSGAEHSRDLADQIEGIMIECFSDEPWFDDASTALAQYAPGGGDHYYDERAVSRELDSVARKLRTLLSDP